MYTIIEDCSPFYIRFVYDNISEFIDFVATIYVPDTKNFLHHVLPQDHAAHILTSLPFGNKFNWVTNRVSLFSSAPGYVHHPHKDGLTTRVSINFGIRILDDKCVTSWYKESDISDNFKPLENLPYNRAFVPLQYFNKNKQTPIKSMVAAQGECVLLNTDIYHDFDNSKSDNTRVILTLRLRNSGNLYFDDVKKIIFNS